VSKASSSCGSKLGNKAFSVDSVMVSIADLYKDHE
jgi:hypothetical protein